MLDIYYFYSKMEENNIILSFKGSVTSELLSSILQIMETKMENIEEAPKIRKKVFNVLVECLQNLYHHIDEGPITEDGSKRSAIFMISKQDDHYKIFTGNFILNENVDGLKEKLVRINNMSKEELKDYYKEVLNNGKLSEKGGGGLGMIDIARKSGQKLDFNFHPVDDRNSFFSLIVKVSQLEAVA
jgi:hypothetical protein